MPKWQVRCRCALQLTVGNGQRNMCCMLLAGMQKCAAVRELRSKDYAMGVVFELTFHRAIQILPGPAAPANRQQSESAEPMCPTPHAVYQPQSINFVIT